MKKGLSFWNRSCSFILHMVCQGNRLDYVLFNNTVAIIFYTLTLKSKWKMVGFVYIQNSQYSLKFRVYSPKFLGFFPVFKNCGFFTTLVKTIGNDKNHYFCGLRRNIHRRFFATNPSHCLGRKAQILWIKRSSLQRIMTLFEMASYKIQVTEPLCEDHIDRTVFEQVMLQELLLCEINAKNI